MIEAPVAGLFAKHRETLEGALAAIRERTYWSAYPEMPSAKYYGETGREEGEAAFKARLRAPFPLDQPSRGGTVGSEKSPYGFVLGVHYPEPDLDATIAAARTAGKAWAAAGLDTRTGVLLEALARLNKRSWELAFATMHTTGQGLMMAFQASGPHAQDRALEAIAYAYAAMSAVPGETMWEKPQGKNPPIRLHKQFRAVPRGIGLVIGCSTFPTWNSYPALFADLETGNAAIVKPHPGAILPLAITVEVLRDVLRENGFDPNVVQLAADNPAEPIARELVQRPEIGIVDFTGGNDFGEWLEENVHHALVYTEKAGVNSVIVDSTDDLDGMARNIAFSLTLYSGQMCTTPQNIFIPRDGIRVKGETVALDAVAGKIAEAVRGLTAADDKAVEVLGAIASEATLARLEGAAAAGEVVLASRTVSDARFPEARVRTPLILKVDATTQGRHEKEQFGPIAFIVPTESTADSIAQAMRLAKERGAVTGAIYSTDADVLAQALDAAADAGVAFSCNLLGNIFVNQSSAFSDFHVSGANPAGNAALTDAQFVAGRFRIVQSRMPVAE